MIMLDRREGSRDLAPHLRSRGLAVELVTLDSGDIFIDGCGPDGVANVGVEYKKLRDLVSSMRSGRLEGVQIPQMLRYYQYSYLLVEGAYSEGEDGALVVPTRGGWVDLTIGRQRFDYRQVESFLQSLSILAGVRVVHTGSTAQTTSQIALLHHWWSKPWDDHKTFKKVYTAPPPAVSFDRPCLVQRMANQLDGVGWEKSDEIAKRFRTPLEMVNADEVRWRMPGIGKVLAKRIVEQLTVDVEEAEDKGKET